MVHPVSNMFPVTQIKPDDVRALFAQDEVCVVCRENFWEETAEIIRTKCKHSFHLPCLTSLISSGKIYCLICTEPLAKKTFWGDYNRLFEIAKSALKMSFPTTLIGLYFRTQPIGAPLMMIGVGLVLSSGILVRWRVVPLMRADPRTWW